MRLIDADKLVEGRDEKDPVRIAAMNEPTFVFSMIEEVYDRSYLMEWSKERLVDYERHTIRVDERTEYNAIYCSVCGGRCNDNFLNFCPGCFTDMREEENGD